MKTFSIYLKKDQPLEAAVFVEGGFSFKAFVFTYLWSLFNRLWVFSFTILAIHIVLACTLYQIGVGAQYITFLNFLLSFYIGLSGNQWKEMSLLCTGYQLKEVVAAPDLPSAQLKFFSAAVQQV